MTQAKTIFYGDYNRFAVKPFRTRWGNTVYMIHDASHVTDEDIRNGIGSPVVNQFDTVEECLKWIDWIELGNYETWPHEAWIKQPS